MSFTIHLEVLGKETNDDGQEVEAIVNAIVTPTPEFAAKGGGPDYDSDVANGHIPYDVNRYFHLFLGFSIRDLNGASAGPYAEALEAAATEILSVPLLPRCLQWLKPIIIEPRDSEAAHIMRRLAAWAKEHPEGTFAVH